MPAITSNPFTVNDARRVLGAAVYDGAIAAGELVCLTYAIAAFRCGAYNRVLAYVCAAGVAREAGAARQAAFLAADDEESLQDGCTNPRGHEFPRGVDSFGRCIYCGADGDA